MTKGAYYHIKANLFKDIARKLCHGLLILGPVEGPLGDQKLALVQVSLVSDFLISVSSLLELRFLLRRLC